MYKYVRYSQLKWQKFQKMLWNNYVYVGANCFDFYRRSDWSVHSVLRDEAELNLFSDRYRSRDVRGFFRAIFPVMLLTPTCGDDTDDTGGD